MSKKSYTPAFKAKVVLEVLQGESELSAIGCSIQIITDALSPVPAVHLLCGIKVPPSRHGTRK